MSTSVPQNFSPSSALGQPVARYADALQLYRAGRMDEAYASCQQVVQAQPGDAAAWELLGAMAYQRHDYAVATGFLQRALQIDANRAAAHTNLGLCAHAQQQFDAALASFDAAIRCDAQLPEAYSNRSLTLTALKRFDDAIRDCDQAIALRADYAEAYNNRGYALLNLLRYPQAIRDLNTAVQLNPHYATAHYNLGVAYHELQQIEPALTHYYQALQLQPDNAQTYWNVALLSLLAGDYGVGWELHEWRRQQPAYRKNLRDFGCPLWLGAEPVQGKTVLLYAEQGLGDTLQFCRYAPMVAALGAHVILAVQRPLVQLLSGLSGDISVVDMGSALPACDFHCPLMSLPLAFKTTLQTIPAPDSYLRAPADKADFWRARLASQADRLRVGLVWSGGFRADQPETWNINARRNIDLDVFARLHVPGPVFISLQKGDPAEAELRARQDAVWPAQNLLNVTSEIHDFTDTAGLIANLDLVISVDTSTAHLAAAMGKPVWLLNRFDTCWRWLRDGELSPWYATVKVYRQRSIGDWDGVIQRVRTDLLALHAQTSGLQGNP